MLDYTTLEEQIKIPEDTKKTEKDRPNFDKPKFTKMKERLQHDYKFRLNIIAIEIEYKLNSASSAYKELNENDLVCELLEAGFTDIKDDIRSFLKSSYVPVYNPLVEYFTNLPKWNESQPDYIAQLSSYVQAKEQDWFNLQFKKMLVRTVACALNEIPFNKHCFTLVGKQNDGKTSFLRYLCPPALKNYIKENLDFNSKDGRLTLCQNLFVNIDELSSLSKHDINCVKSFFTIDKVKERLPFATKPQNFFRTASFLASTNQTEFLTDETGNVRWLVFEIDSINHDNGKKKGYQAVNIDLVYAQAYALLKSGYDFKLDENEIQRSENKNNESFLVSTTEQEMIQGIFAPAKKEKHDGFVTVSDIEWLLSSRTKVNINRQRVSRALKILKFNQEQKYFKEHAQQRKGYYVNLVKYFWDDEPIEKEYLKRKLNLKTK